MLLTTFSLIKTSFVKCLNMSTSPEFSSHKLMSPILLTIIGNRRVWLQFLVKLAFFLLVFSFIWRKLLFLFSNYVAEWLSKFSFKLFSSKIVFQLFFLRLIFWSHCCGKYSAVLHQSVNERQTQSVAEPFFRHRLGLF